MPRILYAPPPSLFLTPCAFFSVHRSPRTSRILILFLPSCQQKSPSRIHQDAAHSIRPRPLPPRQMQCWVRLSLLAFSIFSCHPEQSEGSAFSRQGEGHPALATPRVKYRSGILSSWRIPYSWGCSWSSVA